MSRNTGKSWTTRPISFISARGSAGTTNRPSTAARVYPWSTWITAPEVVQQFGDLKQPENATGTGPFPLQRYEPNVKTVFTRNRAYFRQDQPYVDGCEELCPQSHL